MKQQFHFLAKAFLLVIVFVFIQSFSIKGGDYYKVLLNGKLVAEQYLTKPSTVKVLSLNSTNQNDQLTFYYSHCGKMGKSRSIILKNENGKIFKEWKFSDSGSPDMKLAVKEVLQASAKLNAVSVYYTSHEISAGKLLITLNLSTALARR